MDKETNSSNILIIGACCLDRTLSVASFPSADSKIRSNSCHESCGGNASNTAIALSILKKGNIFTSSPTTSATSSTSKSKNNLAVKLLTKVGDDRISKQLISELLENDVDILSSSPLFLQKEQSTSSVTTVIVSEDINERCCIHTPGTCGEVTEEEFVDSSIMGINQSMIWKDVIHLHCDTRHTKVALRLALEAKKHNSTIPISIDLEKDRGMDMEQLVQISDLIFTNERYVTFWIQTNDPYTYYNHQSEQQQEEDLNDNDTTTLSFQLSAFLFAHYYFQNTSAKEIVITRGQYGSLCIYNPNAQEQNKNNNRNTKVKISTNYIPTNSSLIIHEHTNKNDCTTFEYKIQTVGTLSNIPFVRDTTGAGDSFIAGYILMKTLFAPTTSSKLVANNENDDNHLRINVCLLFATWVAGNKIQGIGARGSIPNGNDINALFSNLDVVNGKELQARLETYMDGRGAL